MLFAVSDGRVGVLVVFAQPVDALAWFLWPFDIVSTSGDGLSSLCHAFGVVFLFAEFAPRGASAGGLLAAVEIIQIFGFAAFVTGFHGALPLLSVRAVQCGS